MHTVKVLKRKDATSVIVAIYIATALTQSLFTPIYQLSYRLSSIGTNYNDKFVGGGSWRDIYLNSFITLVLMLLVLEVLIRLVVWLHPMFVAKKSK